MSSSRSSGNVVSSSTSSSISSRPSSRRTFSANRRARWMRLIARLRAVVISHAAGLAGSPSRGQRSAAIANASCAASSATSKSPRKPISAARTRPQCSRKACSRIALVLHPRAALAGAAQAGGRDAGGELDRRFQVVCLEEAVAADGLLELDERPVGGQRPAVPHAHGGRAVGAAHLLARGEAGGLVERLVVGVDAALLLLRERVPRVRA